ncbi:uncharacterized protein MONBRDRAFT_32796 [Monosiga brevicollis MX1]|uniref:Probable ubiquitin carboxyl-terminal hydrolase MINDY-4 n=1 Tax=Monosiga brevicollis TaxID=81824 RepID=A9V1R9_MONBE|nr:uncharacterized protein MONBRDRAFT_32796 [Monosiga brevicollis MX1]EDQ88493.1 predicted protein [Monosiga brevicollis MX1]|eukprot:XP_001746597.1 hypothetical protein [Monosiga brevicollis MX1]
MALALDELAIGLVREFLARKGFKDSLDALDREVPRTDSSLTKKSALIRGLRAETLAKKYKEQNLSSLLETIVKYLADKTGALVDTQTTLTRVSSGQEGHGSSGGVRDNNSDGAMASAISQMSLSSGLNIGRTVTGHHASVAAPVSTRPPRTARGMRTSASGASSGPGLGDPGTSGLSQASRPRAAAPHSQRAGFSANRRPGLVSRPGPDPDDLVLDDLGLEDVVDVGIPSTRPTRAIPRAPSATTINRLVASGGVRAARPLSGQFAVALKKAIFGRLDARFVPAWLRQNLAFHPHPDLAYGLWQQEGGPCGVLAVVQAYLLRELLFETHVGLQPSPAQRMEALTHALTRMLWRCGEGRECVVAVLGTSEAQGLPPTWARDGVLERVHTVECADHDACLVAVRQALLDWCAEQAPGIILILISAILSRGLDRLLADRDVDAGPLLGAHNYCTQDMVNLLVTGRATSNVHDGEVRLDDQLVLKGIDDPADFGLLSLFEHFDSCRVGVHLKRPTFPIWIVCAESHFTVLFSRERQVQDWADDEDFELCYYDQLARLEEHYVLRIGKAKDGQDGQDFPSGGRRAPYIGHNFHSRRLSALFFFSKSFFACR